MSRRTFRHSIGVVLIDGTRFPDNKDFSFYVDRDGEVTELHGWGARGGTCPEIPLNPPQGVNFHTVYVAEATTPALRAARGLVHEQKARYAECRVWATGELERWVSAGMVCEEDDEVEEVPADLWATSGDVDEDASPAK